MRQVKVAAPNLYDIPIIYVHSCIRSGTATPIWKSRNNKIAYQINSIDNKWTINSIYRLAASLLCWFVVSLCVCVWLWRFGSFSVSFVLTSHNTTYIVYHFTQFSIIWRHGFIMISLIWRLWLFYRSGVAENATEKMLYCIHIIDNKRRTPAVYY